MWQLWLSVEMSPEALTADRVYRDLKHEIMVGRFRPGAALGLTGIAEDFGTSISPVRDALQRLVGERLVEAHVGGGFNVPELNEDAVHCLYSWHGDLMRLAAKTMKHPDLGPFPGVDPGEGVSRQHVIADLTVQLFNAIAASSSNPEHHRAIELTSARLHVLRLRESILPRLEAELRSIWNVTKSADKSSLRIAMWHYHRRRLLKAKALTVAVGGATGDRADH
jgi:DNA-binding FadR family transcriptional regulator